MKIKTETLKEMVNKAVRGASNNKLIPITGFIKIQNINGTLTLTTTDANNYLYVHEQGAEGENLYVVIPVEQFSKLVARMTSEYVKLELSEDKSILTVSGNGKYTIGVPLDEDGNPIVYPDPITNCNIAFRHTEPDAVISQTMLQLILQVCKPSLATTFEVPVYTNYYVGEKVVATDTYKICGINKQIFEQSRLISPEFMNLCDVISNEQVNVYFTENNDIIFITPNVEIYGSRVDGVEEFAIEPISNLLNQDFTSSCVISKQVLASVLDRIALFVGTYDNRAIRLTFAQDGLVIESKQSNGIEKIDYINSENFSPFTCMIDINMLIQQVRAYVGDSIELYYGEDNAIKFVDGNVTQVIALLEDE